MSDLFETEQDAFHRNIAKEIEEIGRTVMPFGRFSGRKIYDLPAEYLQWFTQKGWPAGRLGKLLQIVHQMKVDGADIVFDRFRPPDRRRKRVDE
jgi:uncharacterized protein (DUF3820 family)